MSYNNPASWDNVPLDNDAFLAMLQKQIAATPSALMLDSTRFPAPPVDNPTPPASEESSPSPPSYGERDHPPSAHRHDDEGTKRKADDITDSEEDSDRPAKSQHLEGNKRSATSSSRRKGSSGNTDESRLQKRKEQNRAAQRAFRERKERHVKELEDQLAVLEAKSKNQDLENTSLRELLSRLQNENLVLKQSAFTFNFPNNSARAGSSTTGASASATGNPSGSPKALYPRGPSGPSSSNSSSSPPSEANTSRIDLISLPDYNSIGDDPKKPQYTTIASNPLYTSFRDTSLDPLAWNAFGDYGQDGVDGLNLFGIPPAYGSSFEGDVTSIDEIFSQPFDLSSAFSNSNPSPTSTTLVQVPSDSPGLYRTSSLQSSSDVSGTTAATSCHDSGEGCPKTAEDVRRKMANSVPSTFGPPITVMTAIPSAPSTSSVNNGEPRKADEKDACAHARMAALCADLPRTVKKPNQIEIGRAWEKVRQHPSFEECDIDELCNELSAKARCDGSRPVLEAESFDNIVRRLPSMYKR